MLADALVLANPYWFRQQSYALPTAKRMIGEYGLFIPNTKEHEPQATESGFLCCSCGYDLPLEESFYDHIEE